MHETPEPFTDDLPDSPQRLLADTVALHDFAGVMSRKMAAGRLKGRTGWQTCSVELLWEMLRAHVSKGDPVDVALLAMMIHANTLAAGSTPPDPDPVQDRTQAHPV